MKVIHILLILVYLFLLGLAITEISLDNVCENQQCRVFKRAFEKSDIKNQIAFILDKLCEESVWPFAYIAASILTPLISSVMPLSINMMHFATTFLIIFITFYCIMSFMIYHYIMPLKKYIIEKINDI